jgi:hypothetical protein
MVGAVAAVGGPAAAARIHFVPDPLVQRIVGSWPARWDTARGERLGFVGDRDFESVVRAFVEDDLAPRGVG